MKKVIQIIIALVIVTAVVWMAQGGIAWASNLPATQPPVAFSQPISGQNGSSLAPPPFSTDITESGIYNIGGVCILEVKHVETAPAPNLKDRADAEVPLEESSRVPFLGDGRLLFPGCHVVHYKDNEIVREVTPENGNWRVCFGDTPGMNIQIYYYLDEPVGGSKIWIPLETSVEDTFVCANAPFTGVYMPAGKTPEDPGISPGDAETYPTPVSAGSVVPPPPDATINASGTYSAGGICTLILEYYVPGLADNLHVQFPTEDTQVVPFPENEDLLYLPGCHVLHYRDARIKQLMSREEGQWEICFAARPDKEMTIYFYRDDNSDVNPPWSALETRTENGLACAPLADYSGVYAPAGR